MLAGSPLLARYVSEVLSPSSLTLTARTLHHPSSSAVREQEAFIKLIGRGDAKAAQANMRMRLQHVATRAALPAGGMLT